MAHKVVLKGIPDFEVQRGDVRFSVSVNGRKLGELHVSQGGVAWKPVNAQRTGPTRSWRDFEARMK
jgi:hypothetical protein